MSAPTASLTAATAFTKLIFVARNAFATYLVSSADAASVMMIGTDSDVYSVATRKAISSSSAPMTTRSGLRQSLTAEPSRRNSGFDTTDTSSRSSAAATTRVEPTGTVDLLIT